MRLSWERIGPSLERLGSVVARAERTKKTVGFTVFLSTQAQKKMYKGWFETVLRPREGIKGLLDARLSV